MAEEKINNAVDDAWGYIQEALKKDVDLITGLGGWEQFASGFSFIFEDAIESNPDKKPMEIAEYFVSSLKKAKQEANEERKNRTEPVPLPKISPEHMKKFKRRTEIKMNHSD